MGVFTKHLLQQIEREGVAIDDVLRRVRKGVATETGNKQVPWSSESLLDEVFLNGTMVADGSTYGAPVSQPSTQGSLRIESQPEGAQIFLNGNRAGRTPKTLNGLPTGRVRLEARLDGYEPQEKISTVLAGQAVHVGFALLEAKAPHRNPVDCMCFWIRRMPRSAF